MRSEVVRLFQTLPHECGYYGERTAQNLVIDPSAPNLGDIYERALPRGYRRAGGHVYLPNCQDCRACVPVRVPVARFRPDRSQRRCIARNADLAIRLTEAGYNDERFALYQRYLSSRHRDGGMDDATPEDFRRFLYTDWSPTRFIEFRLDGALVAVAVTDVCANGLSAVYTWFDPAHAERSLGSFGVLSQIKLARDNALDHLYLGFWIAGHPKMDYKARYQPLEVLADGQWQPYATPSNS